MLITAKDILDKVCDVTGVGEKDIYSRAKLKSISLARTLFWITLRINGYTTEGIATIAKRDHSTVARMTRVRYELQCEQARALLQELGAERFEMMIKPQDFYKLSKEERENFSKLMLDRQDNTFVKVERKKRKIVMKKIPDYKNSIIKTVWRVEKC